MRKILHIAVNYKNDLESEQFIESCLKIRGSRDVQFCLVNNSAQSADENSFVSLKALPQVEVLQCPDNPGYFGAAARAFDQLQGQNFSLVILSNTDLKILNEDFYERLSMLPLDARTAAIAPSIQLELVRQEGNPLYLNRPTPAKIKRLAFIYRYYPLAWLYHFLSWVKNRNFSSSSSGLAAGQTLYSPHGCFLILTQSFFRKAGTFQYPVRLYGEEIYLAEQVRKSGMEIVFHPELRILHREKGTEALWIHRVGLSYKTFKFKQESSRFLNEFFNSAVSGRIHGQGD